MLPAQIVKAEKLVKRLQAAVHSGLDVLADEYPMLMTQAISVARDGDHSMLRFLIELMSRMVPLSEDEKTPFAKRVEQWLVKGNVTVHNKSDGSLGSTGRIIEGVIERVESGSPVESP